MLAMFAAFGKLLRVTMLWIVLLPYLVQGIGAASNQLVLIANHDKFPVMLNEAARVKFEPDANGMIDAVHCVMTSNTHLNLLADVFDFHVGWFSIGDGLLSLGQWLSSFSLFVWMGLVIQKLKVT